MARKRSANGNNGRRPRKSAHTRPRKRSVSLEMDMVVLAIDAAFEIITQAGFNYRQQNVYRTCKKRVSQSSGRRSLWRAGFTWLRKRVSLT